MQSRSATISSQFFSSFYATNKPADVPYTGLGFGHPNDSTPSAPQPISGHRTPQLTTTSSSVMCHSASTPVPISASPAALFLSAFSSPTPTQSTIQNGDGDVVEGYTLGGIIGYGASSIIRRASSLSGDVVAVKIIRHSDLLKHGNASVARRRIKHEATVWSTLSHEHILPLFSSVHTNYADYFFTLFCPAGTLFDILQRDGCPALPQDDAGMMFRQVVRGLRYLHEVALYVHRDIKLENVLVDEMGVCRIGDFGMSKKIGQPDDLDEDEVDSSKSEFLPTGHPTVHRAVSLVVPSSRRATATSIQAHLSARQHEARHRNSTSSTHPAHASPVFQPGSLPYAAPELLLPQLPGPLLPHPAQDIWALGVLLYGLLTGRLPFSDSFEPRLQMKIVNGTYEVPPDIGRGAERVLQGCLDRAVSTRWTIARVDEAAWGVGWGTEGDDVTPADSDEEEFESRTPHKRVPSPSRSRSRPPQIQIPGSPEWQYEEPRTRPSLEAASRRSSSRFKRSLSRAPVYGGRSPSAIPNKLGLSTSRSASPVSTFSSSVRSPSAIRSPSSSRGSIYHDSALIISPSPSIERGRGRRVRKSPDIHDTSRSPSPVPSTPPDRSPASHQAHHPAYAVKSADGERSFSRGRQKYSRRSALRTPVSEHSYYFPGDMDVLEESTADWATDTGPTSPSAVSGPSTGSEQAGPFSMSISQETGEDMDQQSPPPILPFVRLRQESPSEKKRCGSVPPLTTPSTVLWPSMSATPSGKVTKMHATAIHTPVSALCSTKPMLEELTRRIKRSKSLDQHVRPDKGLDRHSRHVLI